MNRGKFCPLNIPLHLDDGRFLLVRRGHGRTMVCRQKATGKPELDRPLQADEIVLTKPGVDGLRAVMRVTKRTKKDVHFYIMGGTPEDGMGKKGIEVEPSPKGLETTPEGKK